MDDKHMILSLSFV